MKQAKQILIALVLTLALPGMAFANPSLQYALSQLSNAKELIRNRQAHLALQSIEAAEGAIYRELEGGGRHQRKAWFCSFSYRGDAFEGRGDTEEGAKNRLLENCLRQKPNYGSVCKTFVTNPYITTCVERE